MRGEMRTYTGDAGFSLVELLTATTISLIVLGTAMATFKDAVAMNDTATTPTPAELNEIFSGDEGTNEGIAKVFHSHQVTASVEDLIDG